MIAILYFFFLLMLFSAFLAVINYILLIAGYYFSFSKMGIEKWKSFIPFYNTFTAYSKVWQPTAYFFSLLPTVLTFLSVMIYGFNEGIDLLFVMCQGICIISYFLRYIIRGIFSYKTLRLFSYHWGWTVLGVLLSPSLIYLLCGLGKHSCNMSYKE